MRWIGPPDSEEPAPVVTLTAEAEHGAGGGRGRSRGGKREAAEEGETAGSDGLAIAALIVGALGLIVGGAALARSRRTD